MKFSVRDLFLVTMIMALAVGWWVDHRRKDAEVKAAAEWRLRAGAVEQTLKYLGYNIAWRKSSVEIRQAYPKVNTQIRHENRALSEPSGVTSEPLGDTAP